MTNHEVVQVGAMIAGKYRVERMLGQGGMGIVVQATHLQLHRLVAVKFILPGVLGTPCIGVMATGPQLLQLHGHGELPMIRARGEPRADGTGRDQLMQERNAVEPAGERCRSLSGLCEQRGDRRARDRSGDPAF
jgi:serine/threonine protein kinase